MKFVAFVFVTGLVLSTPAFADTPVPAKSGGADFTLGAEHYSFAKVSGEFRQSHGFTVATLNFSKDGKPTSEHLQVTLMVMQPGPVDLTQFGNGISWYPDNGMMLSSSAKGKSSCTMTLSKLTATGVEGTAACSVLAEMFKGGNQTTLSGVSFSASTE